MKRVKKLFAILALGILAISGGNAFAGTACALSENTTEAEQTSAPAAVSTEAISEQKTEEPKTEAVAQENAAETESPAEATQQDIAATKAE